MLEFVLDHRRCALLATMGTGKTIVAALAAETLLLAGKADKVLVVGPHRVASTTWPDEFARWADFEGLRVSCMVGDERRRERALTTPADIYTINYDVLPWLEQATGTKWPFELVIGDELTRLKSYRPRQGGERAASLARCMRRRRGGYFIGATGTFTSKGLQDVWGQMWFIDGGLRLGRNFTGYKQRYFRKEGYKLVALPHARQQVLDKVKDVCMSVDLANYVDLTKEFHNDIVVDLPLKAREAYASMEKRLFAQLEAGTITAATQGVKTLKCLQLASGAAYTNPEGTAWEVVHNAKLEALESVIEEAAGAPVIVCYHFKSDLVRLQKAFPEGRHLDKKPETLHAFCRGDIPILFLHPASAGHGIDGMQHACNQIVFFSHWWSMEEKQQAIARIGPVRQMQAGLQRPVFVHNIVAHNTMDEAVLWGQRNDKDLLDWWMDKTRKESL